MFLLQKGPRQLKQACPFLDFLFYHSTIINCNDLITGYFLFFDIESLVAQSGLELAMLLRMTLNSSS